MANTSSWRISAAYEYAEVDPVARAAAYLRGREAESYRRAKAAFRGEGCAAASYRLRSPVAHLCVKRLWAELRLVVGFPEPGIVVGLLLGAHSGERNVYEELYALLGVEPPRDGYALRDKPNCCDEHGEAPGLDPETRAMVDALIPELRG